MRPASPNDDTDCPVPLDLLGSLYRAGAARVDDVIRPLSAFEKAELAVYCYGRAHFRELGLTIAARCDAAILAGVAGVLGQTLAAQSRGLIKEFGLDGVRSGSVRRKVTLARAAA